MTSVSDEQVGVATTKQPPKRKQRDSWSEAEKDQESSSSSSSSSSSAAYSNDNDDEGEEEEEEEEEEVIASGYVLPTPPVPQQGFLRSSCGLIYFLNFFAAEYYVGALWRRQDGWFLAGWYSYLLLGDFTLEKASEDINDQLLATLMDPEFARFFPWQTASQFLALRGIHFANVNVHRLSLKWIDFWTFPYESLWQNLADFQDRASWEANRRFFLEKCTIAKWLVNGGEHCLVHLMIDKTDAYYNRIDVGFYVFPVAFVPSFLVANTDNHDNYPWLSDGELGWSLICQNYARRCLFSQLDAEPLKKQKT